VPKYLIIVRDTAVQRRDMSPEEMQRIIGKYKAWTEGIAKAGRLADASKLRDGEGRVLRRAGGRVAITDGPFTESKEFVGGYWLVEAASYDEAVALTKDHPHLEIWPTGSLEIRQLHDYTKPG
jgi:hypothetical protein